MMITKLQYRLYRDWFDCLGAYIATLDTEEGGRLIRDMQVIERAWVEWFDGSVIDHKPARY